MKHQNKKFWIIIGWLLVLGSAATITLAIIANTVRVPGLQDGGSLLIQFLGIYCFISCFGLWLWMLVDFFIEKPIRWVVFWGFCLILLAPFGPVLYFLFVYSRRVNNEGKYEDDLADSLRNRSTVQPRDEKRGRGASLTVISIILAWLALAGFVNAVAGMMGSPIIPAAYGTTALLAAIGLWRVQLWGFAAYVAWVIVVIIDLLVMQNGLLGISVVEFSGFMGFTIVLLTGGGVLAWRGLKNSVQSPA